MLYDLVLSEVTNSGIDLDEEHILAFLRCYLFHGYINRYLLFEQTFSSIVVPLVFW